MHQILDHHEIVADLEERLRKLATAYTTMIDHSPRTQHVGLFAEACRRQQLLAQPGGNAEAQAILTFLVSDLERNGTEFWATPLGRACGWWTGAGVMQPTEEGTPEVSTPTPRVQHLLGVSRQATHQMIAKGALRKNSLTGVDPADVRREMQARYPL